MSRSKVIVTTTTLYPDFTGNDKVRFDLICQLCEEAKKRDYAIVIADGSCDEVKDAFVNRGAHVIAQEKGMGPGRRQVWKEAAKLVFVSIQVSQNAFYLEICRMRIRGAIQYFFKKSLKTFFM